MVMSLVQHGGRTEADRRHKWTCIPRDVTHPVQASAVLRPAPCIRQMQSPLSNAPEVPSGAFVIGWVLHRPASTFSDRTGKPDVRANVARGRARVRGRGGHRAGRAGPRGAPGAGGRDGQDADPGQSALPSVAWRSRCAPAARSDRSCPQRSSPPPPRVPVEVKMAGRPRTIVYDMRPYRG
jgi:hypothetical protein